MLSKRVRYLNYLFHGLLLATPVIAYQGIEKTTNLQAASEGLTWGSRERNLFYLSLILLGIVYYVKVSIVSKYRESKRSEEIGDRENERKRRFEEKRREEEVVEEVEVFFSDDVH